MKVHVWLALIPILCCLLARPAPAETVVEAWRGGGFFTPISVSVNPAAPDASRPELGESCWVADVGEWTGDTYVNGAVTHLSATGAELWQGEGFNTPDSVSVNPTDGSCWVTDAGEWNGSAYVNGAVVHLSAAGAVLWWGGGFDFPYSVSVNPTDGSCWVTEFGEWNGDTYVNGAVVHLSASGAELWRGEGYDWPASVSVNSADGSCWVADTFNDRVVHLSATGNYLWHEEGLYEPWSVSVNSTDGSCWVADTSGNQVVHLSVWGNEQWWIGGFSYPESVSVNPTDGSCWVADGNNNQVVHLSASGAELWRGGGFDSPYSVSVNPTDGSCWVADIELGQVAHLVIQTPFEDVDYNHWALYQIEACVAAGIVSGYPDGTYQPGNPVTRDQMAVYISRALAGGDENVPEGPGTASFVDVPNTGYGDAGTDPHWAYKYVEYAVASNVVQGYAYDDPENPGETTYRYEPTWTVTRDQMAVYVARAMVAPTGEAALADYVPADPRNFPDVPDTGYGDDGTEPFWAYTHIEYCVDNGVVAGYDDGLYHPDWVVTRDQMAVYVARAFGLTM